MALSLLVRFGGFGFWLLGFITEVGLYLVNSGFPQALDPITDPFQLLGSLCYLFSS